MRRKLEGPTASGVRSLCKFGEFPLLAKYLKKKKKKKKKLLELELHNLINRLVEIRR